MTIEEALLERLKADSVLFTLIANRVAPFKQVQGVSYPCMVYRRIGTDAARTQAGRFGLESATFRLDFWSNVGQEEITTIREALVRQGPNPESTFLDGCRGQWGTVFVQRAYMQDVSDIPEPPLHWDDKGLYGESLDLFVYFQKD